MGKLILEAKIADSMEPGLLRDRIEAEDVVGVVVKDVVGEPADHSEVG